MTLWTVAPQAPLSLGCSRQEYWSGLPCLPPGDLPDPEIDPASLMAPALAGGFFTAESVATLLLTHWTDEQTEAQGGRILLCHSEAHGGGYSPWFGPLPPKDS